MHAPAPSTDRGNVIATAPQRPLLEVVSHRTLALRLTDTNLMFEGA